MQATALARLRRVWARLALLYGGLIMLASFLLREAWNQRYAMRWTALAALALVYQLWTLWQRLPENHREGKASILPTLGLANLLSLLRGLLLGFLAGFLFVPRPPGWLAWAPGGLYTAAIVIDLLDGLAARATGRTTVLGSRLDMEFDAFGILIAPLLGVLYGQLPVWYLLVGAARYLFVIGTQIRQRLGKPVYGLPPSAMRRPMAGIQMGFISAVLWPVLEPPATTVAATLVMIPFVGGFVRDWLAVSGSLDPASEYYQRLHGWLSSATLRWLPLALRASVAAALGATLAQHLFGAPVLEGPSVLRLMGPGETLLAALIVAGLAGRLAATLLLIFTGIGAAQAGFLPGSAALIASTCLIMLFGTGALSIWQPEERFLSQRLGKGEKD